MVLMVCLLIFYKHLFVNACSVPEGCGSIMHPLEHIEALESWSTLCYIDTKDKEHVKKSCRNLLRDLPGFKDAEALLDQGGDFGCLRVSDEMEGTGKEACREGFQHDTKLSQCPSCTSLVVCIRYPGVQELPESPSPTPAPSEPPSGSSIAPPIGTCVERCRSFFINILPKLY